MTVSHSAHQATPTDGHNGARNESALRPNAHHHLPPPPPPPMPMTHPMHLGLLPQPPPPYSTLPTRNQRRLIIEPTTIAPDVPSRPQSLLSPQSFCSTPSNVGSSNNVSQSGGTSNQAPCPAVLPSYHHLYSSSSPSTLRRRRHRLRQRRRESCRFEENKKYLIL